MRIKGANAHNELSTVPGLSGHTGFCPREAPEGRELCVDECRPGVRDGSSGLPQSEKDMARLSQGLGECRQLSGVLEKAENPGLVQLGPSSSPGRGVGGWSVAPKALA